MYCQRFTHRATCRTGGIPRYTGKYGLTWPQGKVYSSKLISQYLYVETQSDWIGIWRADENTGSPARMRGDKTVEAGIPVTIVASLNPPGDVNNISVSGNAES
jgi:hypothetical protein